MNESVNKQTIGGMILTWENRSTLGECNTSYLSAKLVCSDGGTDNYTTILRNVGTLNNTQSQPRRLEPSVTPVFYRANTCQYQGQGKREVQIMKMQMKVRLHSVLKLYRSTTFKSRYHICATISYNESYFKSLNRNSCKICI